MQKFPIVFLLSVIILFLFRSLLFIDGYTFFFDDIDVHHIIKQKKNINTFYTFKIPRGCLIFLIVAHLFVALQIGINIISVAFAREIFTDPN